jgi:hypothetical protein
MAVETSNFSIRQGDTVNIRIYAKDSEGNYLDLTNYSVTGSVRERFSSTTALFPLSPTIHPSLVSGIVDITISSSDTESIPVNRYVYDIEVYDFSSTYKVANGYLSIQPEVTR